MTVLYPLDAFDHALPVARRRPAFDHGKLISVGLTIAFHVAILAAALTAVKVSQSHVMQELSVSVTPQREKPKNDPAPPPKPVAPPAPVTTVMPEVTVQTASPIVAVAPAPQQDAVPPAPPAPPSPVTGEGKDAFLGRVLGQLQRFKQYPRAARQAHIEGVVLLHFVMDAQGKVVSFEIAKSSGRPVLDAEAMALIQRAQPLPAIPTNYPTHTLDAVVPIEFYLDRQ